MIQAKIIIFTICVYSFVQIQPTNGGCFGKLGNLFRKKPEPTAETAIDLTFMAEDSIEYYKYALILFCRVMDMKFFGGKHPSRMGYTDLELFDETSPEENWDGQFDRLMSLFMKTLKRYHKKKSIKSNYLAAYYYRLLKWLEITINKARTEGANTDQFVDKIKEISKGGKWPNYISDIFPPSSPLLDKIYQDLKENKQLLKMTTWKQYYNEYDAAIIFFADRMTTHGESVEEIYNKMTIYTTKIEIYMEILNEADPVHFFHYFLTTPWSAVYDVDWMISCKVKDQPSPFVEAIKEDDINLSNLQRGTIEYYKHAAILFLSAFERKFWSGKKIFHPAVTKVLNTYPTREVPGYHLLRYCAFQDWISNIPESIRKALEDTNTLFDTRQKAHFHRMLKWFKNIFPYEETERCREQVKLKSEFINENQRINRDEIDKLLKLPNAEHIVTEFLANKNDDSIFNLDMNKINKLEDLEHLGEQDDIAIITVVTFGTDQFDPENMCTDYSHCKDLIKKMEETTFKVKFNQDFNARLLGIAEYLLKKKGNGNAALKLQAEPSTSTSHTLAPIDMHTTKIETQDSSTQQYEKSSSKSTIQQSETNKTVVDYTWNFVQVAADYLVIRPMKFVADNVASLIPSYGKSNKISNDTIHDQTSHERHKMEMKAQSDSKNSE